MEKRIKDFSDYAITDSGKVISYKYKTPKVLSTWCQKAGYENIKLSKNNETYHFLVHRLVAEAFIPNPENLPEVNHKDNNPKNNCIENLEWCTRKYNLDLSYKTMSPTRNYVEVYLIREDTEEIIKRFKTIKSAAEYANKNFNCSVSGMIRNYRSNGYRIEKCND